MLTIFTTCRPCNFNSFELQQRQAMHSWMFLKPKPQVLVMGDDFGAKQIAEDYSYEHIPNVKTSEYGTPMLDDMFRLAETYAKHNHIALVSSDVFLFQDTITALEACKAKFDKFCAVCRKRQQANLVPLNFDNEAEWHATIKEGTHWNLITSGDFYMFSRGFWENKIPPFIIGRCVCDSWLFWYAQDLGLMIDLSLGVTIVDYKNNHDHWKRDNRFGDREKEINVKLAGKNKANVADANWLLTKNFQIVENELKKEV